MTHYTQRDWDRTVGWGKVPKEYDMRMNRVEKYLLMRMDMLQEELQKNPSDENTLVINHSIGELSMVLDLLRKQNTTKTHNIP